MDKTILNDMEMIFVVEGINEKNNGITESVIRKIKYITDAWGVTPTLLAANYNPFLPLLELSFTGDWLQENQTRLPDDNIVFGVFDYFQNCYPYNRTLEMIERFKPEESPYRYDKVAENVFAVFNGDVKLRTEHYTYPRGLLQLIQIHSADGDVTKTLVYDRLGYLSRVCVHDNENKGFCPTEYYYDTDQKLRIQAEYAYIENPEDSKFLFNRVYKTHNEIKSFTVFDGDGNIMLVANNHEELASLCLDGLTSDPDKVYLICDECAQYSGAGARLNKKNVANAAVLHSKFLDDPYNIKSTPQPFYKYICENRRLFDGIVVLTNEATKDFIKKYGQSRKLFTIGHPYPHRIAPTPFDERDGKRCIVVSRLDPLKRIDMTIEIFAETLKDVPSATLDIYGFGQDEQKLKEKIEELGIAESVKLKGFTAKAAEEMSRSACFLFTSGVEGFGITLIESISNGCPVFSFDIKYGPATIIKNGVTGFLFKDKAKRAIAKKLVEFLSDEDLQQRMSRNCYDDAPRFGVEAFMEKWGAFTEAMYHKAKRRMSMSIVDGGEK